MLHILISFNKRNIKDIPQNLHQIPLILSKIEHNVTITALTFEIAK